jgi:hypothetical protein
LQTSVPTATYAAASQELSYFTRINAFRQANGLGLLAQNALLDEAVRNHVAYFEHVQSGDTIIEAPANTGFTGATPQDRCDHVGYAGTCEQTAMWPEISYLGVPSRYIGQLVVEQGEREIGIAMTASCLVITGMACGPQIQLGLANGATPQRQADGFLLIAGLWTSLHVQINEGETLEVSSLQLRDTANNAVAGQLLSHANDSTGRIPPHAIVFSPTSGWQCGAKFTVDIVATRNGTPFSVNREVTWACP